MEELKLAETIAFSIQDMHCSDIGPVTRKDNYLEALNAKMEVVAILARKLKVEAVFNAGDIFHKKKPKENSHHLVQNVIKWHMNFNCRRFGVTGNHDITKDDLKSLSKQPIGTVYSSGALERLESYDRPILWSDKAPDFRCFVWGFDFRRDINKVREWLLSLNDFPKLSEDGVKNYLTVVCHCYAKSGDAGKVYEEDSLGYNELDLMRPDVFVFGHDHRSLGCGKTSGGKVLLRQGALTRGTISNEDIKRKPAIGWVRFTKDDVQAKVVIIPHAQSSAIFDFTLQKKRHDIKEINDEFISELKQSSNNETTDIFSWFKIKMEKDGIKKEYVDKSLEMLENQGLVCENRSL